MTTAQVTVPDIGGAEGAEVIEILVAVGDEVVVDQGLIVLESDKASMEIPSTLAGKVVELLVSEGEELAEGAPVALIAVADGETTADQSVGEVEQSKLVDASTDGSDVDTFQPSEETDRQPEESTGAPRASTSAIEQLVVVPDIGTDDAVELIEVCVSAGDSVAEGDSLVVLESDKASMEVPSPLAGEVLELLADAGTTVSQGDKLMTIKATVAEQSPAPERAKADSSSGDSAESAPIPKANESSTGSQIVPSTPAPATPTPRVMAQSEPATNESTSIYAGPAVRKLAREFGVDLQQVNGSGPKERVLKEDLQQFVKRALSSRSAAVSSAGPGIPAVPDIDFSQFGPVEVTKRNRLEKLTADNMQRSWLNVPHVTQFDQADITELEAFRKSMKAEAERRDTRLTPMPFLLKACSVALREHPKLASSLAAGGDELVFKQYCHIGMAVDTPAGLVVPVIRDVDKKTVWQLADDALTLAHKARDRKLAPGEMKGGCFTISSLGSIGGSGFTPIVNTPEVAILGVSNAEMRPVWDGESFLPRKMLPLALSYDHRVINGGDGGRFLSYLVRLLGDIRQLLM
ncbi:MAG: dihydrolipoyllysine-residue acetyltransferase [Pseudomonadota bacterium]